MATSDNFAWSNTIYVAETDAKAVSEARPHLEALVHRLLRMPIEMLLPPGYTSIESLKRIRAARPALAKPQSIEGLIIAGVVIVGGPESVRQKLAGFNTSLTKTQFGTLPADMTRANMDAIAREVLPYFLERGSPEQAATATGETGVIYPGESLGLVANLRPYASGRG